MPKFSPPSPPFIAARNKGGKQVPKAVVMHGTVSSDNPGTARNIAEWWAGLTSPMSSAHYTRDPKETIQSVPDHVVAYHCGHNQDSIGYELCDEQQGPPSRWADADSLAILHGAANDVADLCLAYKIKPKRPSIAALKRRGPHGIYGHDDSRQAFGGTTHTDPRDFPWEKFLGLVRQAIVRKKRAAKASKKKQFKVLHAPLRGVSATPAELKKALNRPGVVSVAFSEAYKHTATLRRQTKWRTTTGAAKPKDANGRSVRRDVAILTRRWRKSLATGVRRASVESAPLRIAPERWLAFSVAMIQGKPLAHISVHPHAVVRSDTDWRSDRGEKYRDAMKELYRTVIELRAEHGEDLDIIITGDLQYRKGDPARAWSPKAVFDALDLEWVATGIDWMAHSSGLRRVKTVVVPTEVNGQDHPWIEGTFERRVG